MRLEKVAIVGGLCALFTILALVPVSRAQEASATHVVRGRGA